VSPIDLSMVNNNAMSWVHGNGVAPMQRLLQVRADGIAGPGTRSALYAAQMSRGLRPDVILGADVVFLGMLLVGAAQGGIGVWVRGQTVAVDNVVAYVSPASTVVAGSALMGVQTGVPVDVVPAAQ